MLHPLEKKGNFCFLFVLLNLTLFWGDCFLHWEKETKCIVFQKSTAKRTLCLTLAKWNFITKLWLHIFPLHAMSYDCTLTQMYFDSTDKLISYLRIRPYVCKKKLDMSMRTGASWRMLLADILFHSFPNQVGYLLLIIPLVCRECFLVGVFGELEH